MLKKPVRVSKNSLVGAIRTQRKASGEIKWVVLGVMREGVEPTALILDQKLITERNWYEPKEYDVIAKVDDYELFRDMNRLATQEDVVNHIYNLSRKWELFRREEWRRAGGR